ncbi:MAG: OmpH family outer membrane protein [Rikenellaceae bacterium]|nr:OmpH family outer membrane protein [Rikenellaceae bacterium]MCL2692218.1 OmpH family outer membrane protein [Rikenellaceae bacterium]
MRKTIVKLTLAVAALLFIGGVGTTASAQKFGYIDMQELVFSMPEVAEVEAKLMALARELETQGMTMMEEFERKRDEFNRTAETMSESVRRFREEELSNLIQRIENFQQTAQGDIQRQQSVLFEPLIEKAQVAVRNVAVEQGLTAVFAATALVYSDPATMVDVLPLARRRLGIN